MAKSKSLPEGSPRELRVRLELVLLENGITPTARLVNSLAEAAVELLARR
jgi:hypothetical protein